MYDIKALYEAHSVKEAIELLTAHPEARIIAGGSDVLVQIREGRLAGREWVSISGIQELKEISYDGGLSIGALATFTDIAGHPLVQEHCPVLGEAVLKVGGPQIRNIGTIGGNTCNGVTSADSASTLLAYDAIVELQGPSGRREIPIEDFYLGPGRVDLRAGELQRSLFIPEDSLRESPGYFIKYAMRKAMDIATIGCSVNCRLDQEKKRLERVRIAFGVAGPVPLRARGVEAAAQGLEISRKTLGELAKKIPEDLKTRDSWRASRDFRNHMAVTMAERCLVEAIRRGGGDIAI